jgi:hypothetical protein
MATGLAGHAGRHRRRSERRLGVKTREVVH